MTWSLDQVERRIAECGCIAMIGQVDDKVRRQLEKQVSAGRLAKWRATWTAPLGGYGIGPLKTVYGLPHLNPQVSA
jgi:hypothetical protein